MGYTYVMSDIHGMAHLVMLMLEKLDFSEEDTLYILGDMIDRGPDPAGVMDLAMSTQNIIALKGNHEDMFVRWYEQERGGGGRPFQKYYYNTYELLMENDSTRTKIPMYVQWMKSLPLYKKLKIGGSCWLLAHASTEPILQIWRGKEMLLWDSNFVERDRGPRGYHSVVGHVPTLLKEKNVPGLAKIWRCKDGSIIDIDCGAVFPDYGGRLGCLCLETGEEFYVCGKDAETQM